MIQKCRQCGQWCETENGGVLNRYRYGLIKSSNSIAEFLGGDNPGIASKAIGTTLAVGASTPPIDITKAVFGKRYQFHCPNCGCEWGTNNEKDDQIDIFLKEREDFADNYLSREYNDRKAILIVDSITSIKTSHIDKFSISYLPNDISFPIGHPVVNHIYIGHPYKPQYIPIEDYPFAFVVERVQEFCEFVQALGATEVTVETLNTSNKSQNSSQEHSSDGATQKKLSVKNSHHDKKTRESLEEKLQVLNKHQGFNPSKPVHLHKDMVWYPHESDWQRLYRQRLDGLSIHEERIETRKSEVLSKSELIDIQGEIKSVFEANGKWSSSMEDIFKQEDNAVISIKVKFAPLSELPSSTDLN